MKKYHREEPNPIAGLTMTRIRRKIMEPSFERSRRDVIMQNSSTQL